MRAEKTLAHAQMNALERHFVAQFPQPVTAPGDDTFAGLLRAFQMQLRVARQIKTDGGRGANQRGQHDLGHDKQFRTANGCA